MSEQILETQTLPPTREIDGVAYVLATDAASYLPCSYTNVINKVNSRHQYLIAEKIGATLFITLESLIREKARMDARGAK